MSRARVHVTPSANLSDNVEIPLDYGTTNFGSEGQYCICDSEIAEDTDNILKRLKTSGDFKVASLNLYSGSSIYVNLNWT